MWRVVRGHRPGQRLLGTLDRRVGVGREQARDRVAREHARDEHDRPAAPLLQQVARTTSRAARNAGAPLMARVSVQPSSGISWTGPSPARRPEPPATANSPSTRPNASRAAATAASAAASSRRSADANPIRASGPAARPMSATSASPFAASRATTQTAAPSATNRRAPAAAMPLDPVTTTTRPASRSPMGDVYHTRPRVVGASAPRHSLSRGCAGVVRTVRCGHPEPPRTGLVHVPLRWLDA